MKLVNKWIEALETTPEDLHLRWSYKHDGGRFCALGLLYRIAAREWGEEEPGAFPGSLMCKVSTVLQHELGLSPAEELKLEEDIKYLSQRPPDKSGGLSLTHRSRRSV